MSKKKQIDTGRLCREAPVDISRADNDDNVVELSFSSEYRAKMFFGDEILVHTKKAADFSRLNNGAPLLWSHNRHDAPALIGVVEKAWLDESTRKGRARVRFSKNNPEAARVKAEVHDGIIRNVSFAYMSHESERDKDDRALFRTTRWEALELSFVSVPADPTVGIGRAQDDAIFNQTRIIDMPTKKTETKKADTSAADENTRSGPVYEADLIAASEQRAEQRYHDKATQIALLAERQGCAHLIAELIRQDVSIDEAKSRIAKAAASFDSKRSSPIGLSAKESRRFSFARAIYALANPMDTNAQHQAGFEIECSRAASDRGEGESAGIRVPVNEINIPGDRAYTAALKARARAEGREYFEGMRIPRDVTNYRDITVTTEGVDLVAEELLGGSFIDVLRNLTVMNRAGARFLTDLRGDIQIPTKTAGATFGWVGTEGDPTSESTPTFGQVSLTPKLLGGFVDYTRKLLKQSSIDVEQMIRADFAAGMAVTIDESALNGPGTGGEPTGLTSTAGINTTTIAVAGQPTFEEIVDMETQVNIDNALLGSLYYVTTAAGRGHLKTTAKDAGSGIMLWERNEVNGYPAIASGQVTADDFWFGNFADVLIGMWGGLDLLIDPYTASSSGTVRAVAHQDVDVAVRRAVSFCRGSV